MSESIKIMGVKINNTTLEAATKGVNAFFEGDTTRVIYTPNTEMVMIAQNNPDLKFILNRGDYTIPDGIGLIYASRIKKKPLKERVTGFDLSIKILEIANDKGYKLFLLGGAEGVAEKAAVNIKEKYPNIEIAGYHHGYFKGTHVGHNNHQEEQAVIEAINRTRAEALFVGFGAPRQEKWIDRNKDLLNTKVIIGNGGTIDILSGQVKLAPEAYRKLGLEWFYRLLKNPKRLRRQLVLPVFMFKVLFSRDNIVE